MAELRRIVVGVDGSDNAGRALDWAITLGRPQDAEIVAVHAVGLLAHLDSGPAVPAQSHLDELHLVFETRWCAPLANCGLAHRMRCVDGTPVVALLETAEREDADMVVVGRRGAGGFPALLLGSTSHQLAQHCTRPLLIVPSAALR